MSALVDQIEGALAGRGGRRAGNEIRFRAPCHDDQHPSARWNREKGTWFCDPCGIGGGTKDLAERLGLDLPRSAREPRSVVAEYDYRDERGALLFQVLRFAPKGFSQRRPDGRGGWTWKLEDTRRVLYRLPELLAADPSEPVFVTEGEKATEALRALGLVATNSPHGAGKWRHDYAEWLRGRDVVILPDNDEPGQAHARTVATSLAGSARSVRTLDLPGLPPRGDAADWTIAGGSREQLLALASGLPVTPVSVTENATPAEWPEPEDRGDAVLSDQGDVEYVDDLIRPGRIVTWAAEEGSGKSYTVDGELGIRLSVAGGDFAGTWPVVRQGPVLILSEMHADDDYARESTVLDALGLERSALRGKYFRLPLMTAAHGAPALGEPAWRSWVVEWCKAREVILLVFDTATGATQVDPWGKEIQAVYAGLRLMLEQYPALAIVLVVHVKKPQGRGGERRISDVLGEWGRWCDVVVLQERDGVSRTKLATFKRVRRERHIIATKADGLLIDPTDIGTPGPKVAPEKVIEAVRARPGMNVEELGAVLKVSKRTAGGYAAAVAAGGELYQDRSGPRGAIRLYLSPAQATEQARNTAQRSGFADLARSTTETEHLTAQPRNHLYRLRGQLRGGDHASPEGRVVHCLVCGADVDPDDSDLCAKCADGASA